MAAYETLSLAKRIVSRHSEYIKIRARTDDQVKVIKGLFRPDLIVGMVGQKDEGGFAGSEIMEGTAPHAAMVWQRGMAGNMFSRKSAWFRNKLREPPLDTGVKFKGNDQINQYNQDFDDHMIDVYRRSNFYDVMGGFILDGGTTSSPVMLRERDLVNDRIICKVPDCSQRWISKDVFGYDNSLHVLWEWNAIQALQYFGKDKLPDKVKKNLENGDHYTKSEYLQVIYAAGDPIFDNLPKGEEVSVTHPWMEFWVNNTDVETEQAILKPKNHGPGYFTRPFSSWHYWRNWHETYGRSMAWWAVFDVKGANRHWEALFGEAAQRMKPPTWAMGSLKGILDLSPGGDNWADDETAYDLPPKFIERQSGYEVGMDFADRLAMATKRHFHNDRFVGAMDIVEGKAQPETAYAHWRMESQQNVQLLPMVETLENQVLRDNHEAFVESERMAEPAYPWGRLPEPPDIAKEFGDGHADVEFIGQLSIAQERDITLSRYFRNIGMAEILFNISPELIEKIRWGMTLEDILEAGNFPQKNIVSEEEFEEIKKGIRQRELQAELAEMAPKIAMAAKNLQGKTEDGSPLKQLTGAVA